MTHPMPRVRSVATLMTEHQLKDAVIDRARELGWLVFHPLPAPAPRSGEKYTTRYQGDKGFPDLTLARKGRQLFVELKREGERPSQEQIDWLSALGGGPFIWDSKADGELQGRWVAVWRPRDWFSGLIERELSR